MAAESQQQAAQWAQVGAGLLHANDLEGAVEPLRKALALAPGSAAVLDNLGITLCRLGHVREAVELLRRAVELQPNNANTHMNLGIALLGLGEFEEAWREMEWRDRWEGFAALTQGLPQPLWDGEPLEGKTILLHGGQGFGDTLHLARYVPLLWDRGARVVFHCAPAVHRLLRTLRGRVELVGPGQAVPAFDYHCPVIALPMAFRTTLEGLPREVPYLSADAADVKRWGERLSRDAEGLRVGLVWAGSGAHEANRYRSTALSAMAPLAEVKGVSFYNLQLGQAAREMSHQGAPLKIIDHTRELRDFAETAALIANLDLVISVDTAVAHLAGALAKPVWTLLSFTSEWRWMLERSDSPWYPTMTLFRQPVLHDWDSVMREVGERLRRMVSHRERGPGAA
ncbi:MAG TPA: tetratricopeptide repeat protein [Tepidisphaeraceae bacterium]|jgi:hypothetical protein